MYFKKSIDFSYIVDILDYKMVSRRTNGRRRRATVGTRKRRGGTSGTTSAGRRVRPKRAPKSATMRTRARRPKRRTPRGSAKSRKTAADIAVFHNPFSKATQQARIPDGKATASLGTRVQAVSSIVPLLDANNDAGENILHVFLYPGLGGGCQIFGTDGTGGYGTRDFTCLGFQGHGLFQQNMNGAAGSWPNQGTPDESDIELIQTNGLAKWRLVSQGLNMKLVNNDESNDGWFEAVRINQVKDLSDYQVSTINNSNTNTDTTVMPGVGLLTSMQADLNLVEEPSYQTGLLKDIHKHVFCNHPIEDTPFTELRDTYKLRVRDGTGDVGGLDAGTDVYTPNLDDLPSAQKRYVLNKGSSRANDFVQANVDQHHDIVYIRIHGRTPPAAGGQGVNASGATELLFHLCANHEIMYDSSRDVSKYMQPGERAPRWDAQFAAKKNSTAAADVNMGTSAMA